MHTQDHAVNPKIAAGFAKHREALALIREGLAEMESGPAGASLTHLSARGELRFNEVALAHLAPGDSRVFVVRGEPGELRIYSEAAWRRRVIDLDDPT